MASFHNACQVLYNLFVRDNHVCRYFLYRYRFPGLNVASSADLEINGQFIYGTGTSIGSFSKIIVFSNGRLDLSEKTYIGRHVELATDTSLHVGTDTSIQDFSVIVGQVTIGDYCLVSYGVMITSGRHNYRLREGWLIRDQDELVKNDPLLAADINQEITIGDDCWIGAHAVLMPGITIGKGCVIGANSVVNEDIPPYSIAVGAPARVVRKRLEFSPPTRIEANNPLHLPYFYSGFSVTQRALARTASLGGIAAARSFSIALSLISGKTISLLVRVIGEATAKIYFGDQVAILSRTMTIVTFKLPTLSNSVLKFSVDTSAPELEVVLVSSAWVE